MLWRDLDCAPHPGQAIGCPLPPDRPACSPRSTLTTFKPAAGDHVIDVFISPCCRIPWQHASPRGRRTRVACTRVNQTPFKRSATGLLPFQYESDAGEAGLTVWRVFPCIWSCGAQPGEVEKLTAWLHDADHSALYGIRRFVHTRTPGSRGGSQCDHRNLEQRSDRRSDQPAEDAEASKRGRAGIDLLRARMILLSPIKNHTKWGKPI